jgi:hypothetical protein
LDYPTVGFPIFPTFPSYMLVGFGSIWEYIYIAPTAMVGPLGDVSWNTTGNSVLGIYLGMILG